jgi:hypothetical protein
MTTKNQGIKVKTFGANEVLTNHYTLTSENNAPLDIWLAVNENNVPYFLELTIDNKNGLVSIKRKP